MNAIPRRIAAVIVAAGRGERAGDGGPKQYRLLGGVPVFRRAVAALAAHPAIGPIQPVIHADDQDLFGKAAMGLDLRAPVVGDATRQLSVLRGLEAIAGEADAVLIHDAARPFVPGRVIDALVDALADADGAAPALPVVDSIRRADDYFTAEVDRRGLKRVQTPQAFWLPAILAAHRRAAPGATDDVAVALAGGLRVALVEGDERMTKLTYPADFLRAESVLASQLVPRTATGFDVHRFGPGDHLWLCGIRLPHSQGLVGHSDADVGLHALTDALLGTASAGDIGDYFAPGDDRWRGAASSMFLEHARDLILARGGIIDHVDVTIICERPKVGPSRTAMVERVAALLRLPHSAVSIKATTTEMLGFTGRGEGIAAQAAASVRLPAKD